MNDQRAATDPKAKTLPKYLYRYRSFPGDADLHQIEEIFTERKLFFPSPATFNDPFDCCMDIFHLPSTPEERREFGTQVIKKNYPTRQQRRHQIRKHEKRGTLSEWDTEAYREDLQSVMNQRGILCLSESHDNLLIWSHYTDGHTGLCLVLNFKPIIAQADPRSLHLVPVWYSKEYRFARVSGDQKNLDKVLRTKSKAWEYEKEWRLIWVDGAGKHFTCPEDSLVGVILGCRISDKHKRLLTEWTQAMTPRPMLIQARRKEREYGLDFFLMGEETGEEYPIGLTTLELKEA